MKKLITVVFLLCSGPVFAACHAVGPAATGGGTGADWNNMEVLPATLVRGDIYYLADGDGTHGSAPSASPVNTYGHSYSHATSGSSGQAEVRKAQSYDFGNGCGIGAGWNTSTMGSGQARWASAGSGTIVSSIGANTTFNGNPSALDDVGCGGVNANPPGAMTGPAPNPTQCGIKIDDSTCTSTATNGCDGGNGVMHAGAAGIIWESVEWFGQGLNSNGNNNSETYFWFANGGTLTNVTITNSYLHNASTTFLTVVSGGWNNGSFDHNYVWGVHDGSVNHGEAVQLQGNNSGWTVNHNIFRDQQTNGDVVGVNTGTQANATIYNNADICSSGGTGTTCRHNDGWLGCFQSGNNCVANNWLVYNNTLSYPNSSGTGCGSVLQAGSGNVFNNNFYYNCNGAGNGGGAGITEDYNVFYCSGTTGSGTHDFNKTSSCANPFSNVNLGVQLASQSSDWQGRLSLGAPYDTTDLYGNAFVDDRGAAQFQSGTPTAVAPSCSPAAGIYTGSQSITLSTPSAGAITCETTNGSTPATNTISACTTGSLTNPVTVASSLTVKAVAGGTGYLDSSVTSCAYTINTAAAPPTAAPPAGTYTSTQSVALSTGSGSLICWNTTGAAIVIAGSATCPAGSTAFTTNISVAVSETIHAVAGGVGFTDSAPLVAAYTININTTPTAIHGLLAFNALLPGAYILGGQ